MKDWTKKILLPALFGGVLILGAAVPAAASPETSPALTPPGSEVTVSEASGWTRFRDSLLGRRRHRHHHHRHHHRHHRYRAAESGGLSPEPNAPS